MKYRVVFNPEAEADLLSLYNYIADRSGEDRAYAYIERIEEACLSLESFPHRGSLWQGNRQGMRIMGFEGRVSIAFMIDKEMVVIFRILYGGRDIATALE